MKKSLLTIVFCFAVIIMFSKDVFAEASTPSGRFSGIKERVQEQLKEIRDLKKGDRTETKEQTQNRIRQSLTARFNNHKKAITRAEILLDKLQLRMDKAKAAGQDTTQMEALMVDARSKLTDAKTKLADIEAKKGTAVDKAGFQAIMEELKAINKDLQGIKEDASKIIKILKSYNSSPESTKSSSFK